MLIALITTRNDDGDHYSTIIFFLSFLEAIFQRQGMPNVALENFMNVFIFCFLGFITDYSFLSYRFHFLSKLQHI